MVLGGDFGCRFGVFGAIVADLAPSSGNPTPRVTRRISPVGTTWDHVGPHGSHCDQGLELVFESALYFFAHMVLRTPVLLYVVLLFGKDQKGGK